MINCPEIVKPEVGIVVSPVTQAADVAVNRASRRETGWECLTKGILSATVPSEISKKNVKKMSNSWFCFFILSKNVV